MAPDFSIETKFWNSGLCVAGLDEVGRGCFAGPVVAGYVVFAREARLKIQESKIRIDDSKKLTPKQREESSLWVKENALVWSTGLASVAEINKLGIKKASERAFRRAVANTHTQRKVKNLPAQAGKKPLAYGFQHSIDFLLIDAFYIPHVAGFSRQKQMPITKGDGKSFTIAAASIIAKVYRDNLMIQLGKLKQFSVYGWAKNKGYGTKGHREAIIKHGITRHHRKTFVETWRRKLDLRFMS